MNEVWIDKRQYHHIEEINAWLRDHVGPGGWAPILDARWHIESAFGNTRYTFVDPKDATLFALRWKDYG